MSSYVLAQDPSSRLRIGRAGRLKPMEPPLPVTRASKSYIPSWRILSDIAARCETHPPDVIQPQVRAIASARGTLGVHPSARRALLISSTIEGGSKLLGGS